MTEKCRSDNASFLTVGRTVSSAYNGFGILFENLPTTGEQGGSPLLNDGGVAGDEIRWELISTSGDLVVDIFTEGGAYSSTGIGSAVYQRYKNNIPDAETWTITAQSAGSGTAVAINWPLFSVAISQQSEVPQYSSDIAISWPIFSVAVSQSYVEPDPPAAGTNVSIAWPMPSVSISQSSTVPDYISNSLIAWPMFSVSILQGEFEYVTSPNARVDIPLLSRRVDIPSQSRRIDI